MPEVIDIAGGNREAVTFGGGRKEAVDHGNFSASLFSTGLQLCPRVHFMLAEGKQPPGEGGQQIGIQPTLQLPFSFTRRQRQDSLPDFRDRNDRHEKRVSRTCRKPTGNPRIRARLGGFAQDVGIDEIVQSDTLRGRSLLREIRRLLRSSGQALSTSAMLF